MHFGLLILQLKKRNHDCGQRPQFCAELYSRNTWGKYANGCHDTSFYFWEIYNSKSTRLIFVFNKYKLWFFFYRTLTNNKQINLLESRYFVTRAQNLIIFSNYYFLLSPTKSNITYVPHPISTRCQQGGKISRRRLPAPIHNPLFSELTSIPRSIDCNWPNNSCAIRAIRPVSDTSAIYVRRSSRFIAPSHPRLPRASLISTLYCLRHFLFPSRTTFLTYWEILRGKILWISTVLNLVQGMKRRIEKGSNLNKKRYRNDGFIILTYPFYEDKIFISFRRYIINQYFPIQRRDGTKYCRFSFCKFNACAFRCVRNSMDHGLSIVFHSQHVRVRKTRLEISVIDRSNF